MPSQSSPVELLRQSFKAGVIPDRGDGVSEESRLRAALLGVYGCVLHQVPRYEFSSAVLYNQDASLPSARFDGKDQFNVVEDIEAAERILIIESVRDGVSLGATEIIPLDGNERPLDAISREVSASRRTIQYAQERPPQALSISISGVNVVDCDCVNVCVWPRGMPGVRFDRPLFVLLDRPEPIRIDLLENPRAEVRAFEQHLLAVFGNVFGKAFGRYLTLECVLRQPQNEGDHELVEPVFLFRYLPYAEDTASQVRDAVKNCPYGVPEHATLVFELTVFAASAPTLPVLRLSQLLLPVESIADLK